jgi:long-chain acyl-CoA synthetase
MIEQNLVQMFQKSIIDNWNLPAFSNYHETSLSYAQVGQKISFLHQLFQFMDIKKGDKISLLGKNSSNWGTVYLATVSYGATIVPILPDFKADDVHHIVNHSDSKLLFVSNSFFEDLDENSMLQLEAVISLNDYTLIFHRRKNADETMQKAVEYKFDMSPEKFRLPEIKNDALAAIIYTSGTTGFSKGVMLLHNSLISNIVFAQKNMPLIAGETIVSFLPIAHVFGCAFEFLFPFTCGCHITFLGKTPSPKVLIKAFQEIHPRLVLSVPLVIEKIYRKQIKPKLDKPAVKILLKIPFMQKKIYAKVNATLTEVFGGNFREIVLGGAALNEEVESFLRDIKFRYTVGYGMTECGPLISYAGWSVFKKASCGKVVDYMEAKIDSKDPQNVVGEILVRGENVTIGYYKNEQATAEALDKDGWLHTGDLGVMDQDNFIFIKGRSKSMILDSSGKNIYPEELEAKLNNLPYVQESIVVHRDGKLVALVYPDMEAVDNDKLIEEDILKIMETNRQEINKIFPAYLAVNKIEIFPEEFEKTPKRSIKRFLYS